MTMMTRFICIFLSAALISSCETSTEQVKNTEPEKEGAAFFDKILENYHEERLKLYPLEATFSGDNRYNDQLPNDLTEDFRRQLEQFYGSILEQLKAVDKAALDQTETMSFEVLKWECEMNLEELMFPTYMLPIDQMWSMNLMFGQLASGAGAQPFNTVEDYDNWLKRTKLYVAWGDTAVANMRKGIANQVVLPKSLIVKVIPQFKSMTTGPADQHLFYGPVNMMPEGFSQEDKDKIRKAYIAMIENDIKPLYQRMTNFFETEYYEAGRESTGIDAMSFGEDYYRHQIKKYTTTEMSPDEIFELGKQEVARILSEMEQVKQQVGYDGDLKSFFNYVRTNKELMPFQQPAEVIANFEAIHERMKPQLAKLFDMVPKTPFEVRRTEAFREASASAEYNPGSTDGTRPGIFYVPIPDVTSYNVYSDESLFLHEAIPGHHYQISLQQENQALPEFRKTLWYSAYGEGWALYSESLGEELGLYDDPYQYFGMLGAEMHRAIRLVVDAGMHAKGWTREQAIQYSLDNEAESEAGITSEIERYMANPGQALSYKIGQLKIRELRKMAQDKLGDRFDIKAFHNIVLEPGCIPLKLLEDRVNQWVSDSSI